ncbi:MAG TPA: hypothetical protein VI112_07950, partial [Bacteroidia bacterium]
MKRFLFKSFLFMTPILCWIGFVEYRLGEVRNSYNQKREFFERNLANTEVLVLGSSQALYGIDPDRFSIPG